MANTTPINECSIGADAEYTVKVATARGWSDFAIYPNGTLEGVNPDGQRDIVPDFARMAKDAAFDMLAALEAGYSDLRTRLIQYAQSNFGASYDEAATYTDTAVPVLEKMRAAIAKATGEAQ